MILTYTILDWEPTPEQWDSVLESPEGCRRSLDGSRVVLKWEGPTPAPMIAAPQYSHAEILAIMDGPDWSEPEPDEEEAP